MYEHRSAPGSRRLALFCAAVVFGLTLWAAPRAVSQTPDAERKRGLDLYDQNKFTEAIPVLENVIKVKPNDVVVLERLGWATFVVSGSIKDPADRQKTRERARSYMMRAKALGDDSELLRAGLEGLEGPDPSGAGFSNNKEAERAMREGEEAHTRGELDKAIDAYQRALKFDPKLYMAALFAGDMYFKKGYQVSDPKAKQEQMNKAGEWFAKAIAINENVETAYRYWGDALMHSGNQEEALVKFVEAIIAEPGNRNGYMGLSQWGQRNQRNMTHPKIEIPIKLTPSGDGKLDVTFDPALRESADGSGAWEHYGLVRAKWVAADFATAFPNETKYRHSLREETEALRKVAELAAEWLKSGKVKSLSPSLAALVKLNESGLLESYVFFARVDQGIAGDYPSYRQANRDKLRRYWTQVVVAPGH